MSPSFNKARESLKSGELDRAASEVKQCQEIRPDDGDFRKFRDEIAEKQAERLVAAADLACKKADFDEASRLLRQAIGLRPGDAAIQARLDDHSEAERNRRRAGKALAAADDSGEVDGLFKIYETLNKPAIVGPTDRRHIMDGLVTGEGPIGDGSNSGEMLSELLRDRTRALHVMAERSGIIGEILRGGG